MCPKFENMLDQDLQHIVLEHVNTQVKSYECHELDKIIHESTGSTPYKTNLRATSVESSNLSRHETENNREPCKYENHVNCFNLCSTISLNQGINIGKKEYNGAKLDKVFDSKETLILKQTKSVKQEDGCQLDISSFPGCVFLPLSSRVISLPFSNLQSLTCYL